MTGSCVGRYGRLVTDHRSGLARNEDQLTSALVSVGMDEAVQ
jgi:hypothetical protein